MLDKLWQKKTQKLAKHARFEVYQNKRNVPRVVWAEESKNGLGFEIGPSFDDVPTTSQCVTDGQSFRSFISLCTSYRNDRSIFQELNILRMT